MVGCDGVGCGGGGGGGVAHIFVLRIHRQTSGMLLCHLPYLLTTLALTQPTGRLTSSQPRDAPV